MSVATHGKFQLWLVGWLVNLLGAIAIVVFGLGAGLIGLGADPIAIVDVAAEEKISTIAIMVIAIADKTV